MAKVAKNKSTKLDEAIKAKRSALVETDIDELGDKRLSPEEAVHQQRELALDEAGRFRIPGQDDFEDKQRSQGTRLYYTEIIRRLQLCNPAVQVKKADNDRYGNNVALYIPKKAHEFTRSDWAVKNGAMAAPPKGMFFVDHKYCGSMPTGWIPEWGHVNTDTSLLPIIDPKDPVGWRGILVTLIKGGVIRYRDAIKYFGDPRFDQRSTWWFEYLQNHLNS